MQHALDFAPVQLDFAPAQLDFAPVKLDFAPAQLDFAPAQLDFAPVQLDFALVQPGVGLACQTGPGKFSLTGPHYRAFSQKNLTLLGSQRRNLYFRLIYLFSVKGSMISNKIIFRISLKARTPDDSVLEF